MNDLISSPLGYVTNPLNDVDKLKCNSWLKTILSGNVYEIGVLETSILKNPLFHRLQGFGTHQKHVSDTMPRLFDKCELKLRSTQQQALNIVQALHGSRNVNFATRFEFPDGSLAEIGLFNLFASDFKTNLGANRQTGEIDHFITLDVFANDDSYIFGKTPPIFDRSGLLNKVNENFRLSNTLLRLLDSVETWKERKQDAERLARRKITKIAQLC